MIKTLAALSLFIHPVFAKTQLEETRASVSALNFVSPLEPAYSHGSLSLQLGVAAAQIPIESNPSTKSLGLIEDGESELIVPRLVVVTGLVWPLDWGFTFSQIRGEKSQAGSYVQWTLFEAFGLPAVAIRYGFSRLFRLKQQFIETQSGEVALSWGWRWMTFYGSAGAYSTTDNGKTEAFSLDSRASQHALGIQLQILPLLAKLTLEQRRFPVIGPMYQAKLSLKI